METNNHINLEMNSINMKPIRSTSVPAWKESTENPSLRKVKETPKVQQKSQKFKPEIVKEKKSIRPKSPIKHVVEQPLIPVHGTSFSILKTLLPLHNTKPEKTMKNIDTSLIDRSTSPVRYEAHGLNMTSSDPVFIRRSSIRPATLAFFDHGIKKDDYYKDHSSAGGTLDIGGQVSEESNNIQSTLKIPEKILNTQSTQVLLENLPVREQEKTVQDEIVNWDASIQYSSPDESNYEKEAVSVIHNDIRFSNNSKGKTFKENPYIYRSANTDQTLEERLAEWIQSEVLLNLVRDHSGAVGINEKEDIETLIVNESQPSLLEKQAPFKRERETNSGTQTIHEIAIQTIATAIPTQTCFEEIVNEEPLNVSAMEPSLALSLIGKSDEEEVSLTTQLSSFEDNQVSLPSLTAADKVELVPEKPEQKYELSNWELDGIVDHVVIDVSMTELVPIISSSIVEAHHAEMVKKAAALDSDLQKIRSGALAQTGVVHDATLKAHLEIEKEKEKFQKYALKIENDILFETKKVAFREPLQTVEAASTAIQILPVEQKLMIDDTKGKTETISTIHAKTQTTIEESSSSFDESGSSAIQVFFIFYQNLICSPCLNSQNRRVTPHYP